ncbi:hypothetical protein C9374_004211 [Naegleria lovaniensis]|uniref:Uncharacterized protein n=1 Tax=Naegleria lovaniensis TaxID=51637 RepID=A0AA88KLD4_NAELO|nr:uncharacterized protein C9374_004211 [Naegleria lovaniensis]KAG2383540.1 hypothetical protein C9374_004211 [Naegleria lovaniensis]
MQNDKLEEQVQKIALDFFLNGIDPPVSISKKESQSLNNSSPNISSSQSSLENKEFKVPKSKFDKASSKASSRQTTEYDKKMESSLSARRNEMNNKSTSSAKKTASLSLEESSQLDMNTFRSFKQKTSHFINIEAGEVDESARQQFGEIFSQQSFGSPAFSSSIMDMNFSDDE